MGTYVGTVRVRFHPTKNEVFLDKGGEGSTLTAEDVTTILAKSVEACGARKCPVNRWNFWAIGISDSVAPGKDQIPIAVIVEAAGRPGATVTLERGVYGKPRLTIRQKGGSSAKSGIVDIA